MRDGFSPVGLLLPRGVSFERWRQIGGKLGKLANASKWAIGDWIVYGQSEFERSYGRRYREALRVTRLELDVLRDCAYVAAHVPARIRRADLSFTHHRVVAKLEPAEQQRWLARAAANAWTTHELRAAVASSTTAPATAEPRVGRVALPVTAERQALWAAAAAARGLELDDWIVLVLDEAAAQVAPLRDVA